MASRIRLFLCVLALLFNTSVWAIWNESIAVEGLNPQSMSGASVSFTLPSGNVIEGTVDEDEDGNTVMLFPLPGDRPTGGSVTVVEQNGKSRTYLVPAHSADDQLIFNLDTKIIASADGMLDSALANESRVRVRISGGLLQLSNDYLSDVTDGSANELGDLLTGVGATSSNVTRDFDDDASGLWLDLSLSYDIANAGAVYVTGGYTETDTFDGSVNGSGVFGPSTITADQQIQSETDFFSLSAGYEYALNDRWEVFGGLGWAWGDTDLSFVSEVAVDTQILDVSRGSESESWDGALVELGVRYYFDLPFFPGGTSSSPPPLSVIFGYEQTFDGPRDEDTRQWKLGIEFRPALEFKW